jgi:hypothetical protein
MIGPTCPKCGHVGHPTYTVGRFNVAPYGYQAEHLHALIRPTRDEAEADQCAWQAGRSS